MGPLAVRYYREQLDEVFGPRKPSHGLLGDSWKANLTYSPLREMKCAHMLIILLKKGRVIRIRQTFSERVGE